MKISSVVVRMGVSLNIDSFSTSNYLVFLSSRYLIFFRLSSPNNFLTVLR